MPLIPIYLYTHTCIHAGHGRLSRALRKQVRFLHNTSGCAAAALGAALWGTNGSRIVYYFMYVRVYKLDLNTPRHRLQAHTACVMWVCVCVCWAWILRYAMCSCLSVCLEHSEAHMVGTDCRAILRVSCEYDLRLRFWTHYFCKILEFVFSRVFWAWILRYAMYSCLSCLCLFA